MGRSFQIQTNLAGGELDPKLHARVYTQRYSDAVASMINFFVLSSGGSQRRSGLKFVDDEGTVTVEIIPFNIFRTDLVAVQGYLIEFRSDNTVHFYTNSARIGSVSIVSPFTSGIDKIRYEQFDNILYMVHPDFPPQKLVRTDDNTWVISAVSFVMPSVLDAEAVQSVTGITRTGSTATATLTAHGYSTGESVRMAGADQTEYNGDFIITVTDVNTFTYAVAGTPATPATGTITAQRIIGITRSGLTATVTTAAAHGYQTGYIIKHLGADQTEYNIETQITVLTPTTYTYAVTGTPVTPATGTITAQRLYWNSLGYPNSITFFEQRMLLGGTVTHPQTVFCSESGNILNLVTGVADSDPFELTLAAATSRILHLSATQLIIVNTYDGELTIQGGDNTPLTPTNFKIKKHTPYGIRDEVRPLVIAGDILFVTRHGKKMRLLTDKVKDSTQKKAPDISLVSAHLSGLGIIDIAYQLEPDSVIWLVTSTGELLSITYDRDTELLGWAQHTTDGLFKHVAVIPYNDTDQVWVAVERVINSITKTYIEVFDPTLNTDSAIVLTDVVAKTVWTGLSHLEGKTVDVIADGVVVPQVVVSGGSITIPDVANTIEVGLHYKSTLIDLPPHVQTNIGTSEGQAVTTNKCIVKIYQSIGLKINGSVIAFRQFDQNNFGEAVAQFTGEKEIDLMSADDGVVTIEQDQPLPCTILGIIKEVTVNG